MPRKKILSSLQREILEKLPEQFEELAKHYLLTSDDLEFISQRRRSSNKLGFALSLCMMRYPGRTLRIDEIPPKALVEFISEQLGLSYEDFLGYASRAETRREHQYLLMQKYGYKNFNDRYLKEMVRWLTPIAIENHKGMFLLQTLMYEMRYRKILMPSLLQIESMVSLSLSRAEKIIQQTVTSFLNKQNMQLLDDLLAFDASVGQSIFSWLRQSESRPTSANMLVIMERLQTIKRLEISETISSRVSQIRMQQYSREGYRISISHLRQYEPKRRYTLIAITLLEIQKALIDDAITMHDRIIGSLMRRSQNRFHQTIQDGDKKAKELIRFFSRTSQLLIESRNNGANPWESIDMHIGWDSFLQSVQEATSLSEPIKQDHLAFIETHYVQMRKYTSRFLEEFDFKASAGGGDVMDAIRLLQELNSKNKRKLPEDAPVDFIPSRWKPFIYTEEGMDRRYYELCALSELKNRLRSGDIWIDGSKQYLDFDSYLMTRHSYSEMKSQNNLPIAVEMDFPRYLINRQKQLSESIDELSDMIKNGTIADVEFTQYGYSIKPYRTDGAPKEATNIIRYVSNLLPRIKITDLLIEVDSWTKFSDQFTHLRSGMTSTDKKALFAVILSDGINLGHQKMADACADISVGRLRSASDWYIRDENYSSALAQITNHHHQTSLVKNWGDGTTSSSDGQRFPTGGTGDALGGYNAKYGNQPGVVFYTHISDQYSPFHTQIIHANARDATYVLDGLLYHESDLKIEEHYTDTAGFTDHVFALCHLLGFKFAPRIRDIADTKLFALEGVEVPEQFNNIITGSLKIKDMQQNWDDVLRLAASIKIGTASASLLIRKLASYPRQNRLALAIRDVGRIERTLFILEWLKNPSLRSRVQIGLNKGEARNSLARTVFFNRLGEVRDRTFENQLYRASGLNLIVAAIILWNTVYLEKAIEQAKKEIEIPDEFLKYFSPLGWEHINLTGDYVWRMEP